MHNLTIKRIIDLTMPIEEGMRVLPGMKRPTCSYVKTHEGHGLQLSKLEMIVHQGTHVDAPLHMFRGGESVDQIPLDKIMGEAVVFNLRDKGAGEVISADDFEKYAEKTKR